jgi:deoxyinosine 3'endonuclease (endonuclease V)
MAIRSDDNSNSHLYVSIGHRISLETASKLIKMLTYRGSPTPIYLVDRNSRKMIKKFNESDYKSAGSYAMVYLLK